MISGQEKKLGYSKNLDDEFIKLNEMGNQQPSSKLEIEQNIS
jgi:hypothetical protein